MATCLQLRLDLVVRPTGDNTTSPDFRVTSRPTTLWAFNWWNWASVGPFVRTVPWNSRRVQVAEDDVRMYQRVVAFETPAAGEGEAEGRPPALDHGGRQADRGLDQVLRGVQHDSRHGGPRAQAVGRLLVRGLGRRQRIQREQ
jgi:hypothetical protein